MRSAGRLLYMRVMLEFLRETKKIHLKTACIQDVPLQTYGNDFSMIVNDEEFKIS